ncbi:MAG: hypothetical protein MJ051_07750 [Akkermansia sp.]|nr:hypothetical protein [Akkermansia sp.]
MNKLLPFVVGAAALALVSCQGTDPRAASMNYSDAVTRLDQVDPAYRSYFRDQQGSSYGVDEQRKALAAAVQTYRTPVPTVAANVEDRPLASRRSTTASRKGVAGSRKASAKGRTALAKGKSSANKKAVAKKSAAPKKKSGKALAVNTKKRR